MNLSRDGLRSRSRFGPQPLPPGDAEALGKRRIWGARMCKAWSEIEDDLVERPVRLLVSPSSDAVYRPFRGAMFTQDGELEFARAHPLFFVVRNDDVLVLEKLAKTWSEIVYARERNRARSSA